MRYSHWPQPLVIDPFTIIDGTPHPGRFALPSRHQSAVDADTHTGYPANTNWRRARVVCRLCGIPHNGHTTAMNLLHAGVDITVIALWLGHEQTSTTDIYLHADMATKNAALEKTRPPEVIPGNYIPGPDILTWLAGL
ncbi:hypothetical protein CVV68_18205 [Arthrobacter livingstonensis]|uniref:Tyr recombinase domain-containing protein n=1 Tax=Arthrobacter livingstonensis TaxID=670078 RepID=A0A2V5LGD2_9MICC|nr:tyrosine-type recombinase/integrase [Arthrobacter livingstonensis]PYI65500.1 hypothetical protein CVV68_18205 [Arthrobacter livingstonensis]